MPFDDMRRQGPERGGAHERAINLPPAILWIIGLNVAVHLLRQLLSESIDDRIVLEFGLVPVAYTGQPGGDWLSLVAAPFTYQFLHGGWLHLGVNMLTQGPSNSIAALGIVDKAFSATGGILSGNPDMEQIVRATPFLSLIPGTRIAAAAWADDSED